MTQQDERIIYSALKRHNAEHRGDFATCQDDGCKAAQMVKESAQCYPEVEYGISPLASVAQTVFEIGKISAWAEQKRKAEQ